MQNVFFFVCSECVVMAAEDGSQSDGDGSIITVRLQSKDRDSSQEFSLHRVRTSSFSLFLTAGR